MNPLRAACLAATCLVSLTGCADWQADDLGSVDSGIYEIDGWHLNQGGCNADGRSLLGVRDATHVAIAAISDRGDPFIAVEPCTGADDCEQVLAQLADGWWPYVELTHGNHTDGYQGDNAGTTATGEVCRFWDETSTLTIEDGAARFERRTAYVDRIRDGLLCLYQDPPSSHGGCRELETLTATRVADLP